MAQIINIQEKLEELIEKIDELKQETVVISKAYEEELKKFKALQEGISKLRD